MALELKLPDIGEGLNEAEIVQWLVAIGDSVTANQPLVEVETDKAVVEIPSVRAGVVLHLGAAAGEPIHVGDLLVVIGDAGELWDAPAGTPQAERTEPLTAPSPAVAPTSARPKAVPLVRKLAKDMGVDLATVAGSGVAGSITRDDVKAAAHRATPANTDGEPLSKLRRTIADNMVRSWEEIPHVTVWGPAEATRLLDAKRHRGVSLEALLIQAVLPTLAAYPVFNANFDGDRLSVRSRHDIGIAVNTTAGLMVPVVGDAGAMSLETLDKEIARLVDGAQERKLGPAELTGQSFTITNIGAVGGGYGTPIIPQGTTAILSVGRARDEVVARYGRPVVAPMMPLALSFDHRIIDGAAGAAFLNHVTESIELFRS
jgi:pyruvate dehydrogenase E2 component (dihydrolipoamide acetyltransferase)